MKRYVSPETFPEQFGDLIDRFDDAVAPGGRPVFQGAAPGVPHEHTVRVHLLDELVELLGWSLGLGGDVAEEARLKAETTTFMDYLGLEGTNDTPALLIEAKAWDKPFPVPRLKSAKYRDTKLLADAIDHWRKGGSAKSSPIAGMWHDYIDQVGNYVKDLKDLHNHRLPRAVITSGQWIVVFINPVEAFIEGPAEHVKIRIFEKASFKTEASDLYRPISKEVLSSETPFGVRPTQVMKYITKDSLIACFHAVHVSYEASGSPVFGRKPRVLVYPALVLQGQDGMLLTVPPASQ